MPGLGSVPGRPGSGMSHDNSSLYDDDAYFPLTLTTTVGAAVASLGGGPSSQIMTMTSSKTTTMSSSSGCRSSLLPGGGSDRPGLSVGLLDGNLMDLAEELGGGFGDDYGGGGGAGDFDETEPIQSLSLTSTLPMSR